MLHSAAHGLACDPPTTGRALKDSDSALRELHHHMILDLIGGLVAPVEGSIVLAPHVKVGAIHGEPVAAGAPPSVEIATGADLYKVHIEEELQEAFTVDDAEVMARD